jgi:hypothetical protein
VKTAQQFDSRSLPNREFCQYLGANLGANLPSCPPPQWSLAALTLVGFYYSPDIAVENRIIGRVHGRARLTINCESKKQSGIT